MGNRLSTDFIYYMKNTTYTTKEMKSSTVTGTEIPKGKGDHVHKIPKALTKALNKKCK